MRFFQICFVLSKHLIFYQLTSQRDKEFGERLRISCEILGITFIKFGQGLSMRYDLLPESVCEELQKLLDKANVIPYEVIRDILEKEYKGPHTRIFKEFSREPLGSASVSQVHKAVLHDGRVVAVKIKRPLVDKYLRSDIAILKGMVLFGMIFSKLLRDFRAYEVVTYFDKWIQQDTDFLQEAKNIVAIRKQEESSNTIESEKMVCMDIVPEFSSKIVIVMDFIDGIPMNHRKEADQNKAYDVEKSIKAYMNASIRTWFREDLSEFYFQADPHLSNILALPGGRAANIDCGLVCHLSKKEALIFKKMIIAIYLKDVKAIVKIAASWGNLDVDDLQKRMEKDMKKYFDKTDEEGIGFWFFELTKIFIKYKIRYPSYLITLGRANTVMDGLITTNIPDYSMIDILGDELRTQTVKRIKKELQGPHLLRIGNVFLTKMKDSLDETDSMLRAISDVSKALSGEFDR